MKHLNPAQSEPMVSVVIPAYNVTKTLPRLLAGTLVVRCLCGIHAVIGDSHETF